jgi:hypothetical protein
MNHDVMQIQVELNIEKKWDINIENLVVNMVLKKRVKTIKSEKTFFHASL